MYEQIILSERSQTISLMGTPPKVLVTGLGVSGTTYVIQLIGACGFDLGQSHHGVDDRKGKEWEPLWKISVEIWSALGRRSYEPTMPEWNHIQPERIKEVHSRFRPQLENLHCPPAVKLPEANPIVLSCLRPNHVIFMHRSSDGWLASLLSDPKYSHMTRYELFHGAMIAEGLLLDTLETERIPYTIVNYPRAAEDCEYAWDKIGKLLLVSREIFDKAHATVTRSDWIDWTVANRDQVLSERKVGGGIAQKDELSWTGERLVPTTSGQTAVEHLHRYAIAQDIANGKTVLDMASGEGYGANFLAERAKKVIGIDIAADAVQHAQVRYRRDNLSFVRGKCDKIPLQTGIIDLVVSFETLEHHDQHEKMIGEIRRVLRTDGILIISSPNKLEYSDIPLYKNPYHVLELYREQFEELLRSCFQNVDIYGQRMSSGSYVAPLSMSSEVGQTPYKTYRGNFSLIQSECGVHRPIYFIGIASNGQLPRLNAGIFEGEEFLRQHKEEVITSLTDQVHSLQNQLGDAHQQLGELSQDNARLRIFADAVRRTIVYRLYSMLIKPFKGK